MNATPRTSPQWLFRLGRLLHAARAASGSLRVRIGLSVLAASAAGFALLALFLGATVERETREIVASQQRTIAQNVASDIAREIASARDALAELAHRLPLHPLRDESSMETLIRSDGALFQLLDDIVILGSDGVVIADWPVAPQRRGTDRSGNEHFRAVLAGGKPRLSEPFLGPLLQTPVVVLSVPVLDASGRAVAVISGLIRLTGPKVAGDLARRKVGSNGYFMLVDVEGTVMIDPRPERVMTRVREDGAGAAISALRRGEHRLHESPRGGIYAASEVAGTGWTLLTVLPKDEAYRSLASMQWILAAIFGLLLAATGAVIWPLVGRLLAPLTALKAAVQAYGAGAERPAPLDLGRVRRGNAEIDAVADALRRAVERTEATAARLREERAFSAAVVEHAGALVLVLDREGRFVRFNRACEELSGYRFAEIEGKFPWDTVLPPEDANTVKEQAFESLARNPQALSGRYANYWLTKARERRLIEWHNTLLLDAGGAMQFMVSVGIEITEARLMRAALERSETQMHLIMDNVPALIAHYDAEERLLYANRNYCDFYGLERSRMAGRTVEEVIGATNYREASAQFGKVLHGEPVAYIGRRLGRDGVARYVDACAVPEFGPQNEVRGFFWLALDITSRRRAEQASRESETRLKEAQRIAHVGSWELDPVTGRLEWSDEIFRIFEVDQARFGASYEAFLDAIHPEDRDAVNRAYTASVAQRTPYEIVHRLRMADGRIKWVRERCETFYDEAGQPLRSAGTVQDVTAQAEAEERLRASENRLRTILDAEPECVKLLDRDGRLLDMNPAGLAMIEADSLDQVLGHRVCPIVSEADRAAFEDMIAAVFRGENRTLVFQMRGFKGTLHHLETHSVPIWDARRERVTALLGVTRDITARQAMEQALRRNEQHMRLLLDSMPLAVGHADTAERITFANRMYREYFGGAADPVGQTIRERIGDDIYAFAQPYIRQVLAAEAVQYERSFARSDGTTGTRSVRYIPDLSPGGQLAGFFALIEDISERKRTENRIRAALAEKEVLLKEIYHRVKNNLQVVASLLHMQGRGVADEAMKVLLAESANRVASMALVHEQLYRSQDLSNIALAEYLKQLAEHLAYAHRPLSVRVPVRLEVAPELKLGIETAVPLGLIVNELVSNAYKHGYSADTVRGEIVLRVEPLNDGRVRLEVSDDGRGLAPGFDPKAVSSLGLQLVVTLTAQLGGELRCGTAHGCTSFEVLFRPAAREAERLVA